ncbi:MAG: glycosyltransferase, partial [Candidatus Poseidoniales archaeon]
MAAVLPVSVTVLLPTRNEEEAIAMTIDSIPRGWCKNLEIMIVDGNSSDATRKIALDKGIRVHLEDR